MSWLSSWFGDALRAKDDTTKGNLYQQNASAADGSLSNVLADGLSSVTTANDANKQGANYANLWLRAAQNDPKLASGFGSASFTG